VTGTHPRQRPRMDLTGAAAAPCSTYVTSTFPLTLFSKTFSYFPCVSTCMAGVKKNMAPQFVWPESVMSTDFLYAGTFNVHWLSLLCTYTCARRFGYPQDTNGILRMPRYPQDAS